MTNRNIWPCWNDEPIDVIALEIAFSRAGKHCAVTNAAAMQRLGNAIYTNPTYSAHMSLHPWPHDDGVTAPDFP
jgi:hypothetical protein